MSFKDNFDKGGGGGGDKGDLDYDENAFYYFGVSLLLIFLTPATYYMIIKPIFFSDFAYSSRAKNCQCEICDDRYKKRASAYRWAWLDKWFVINVFWISALWYVCYICFDVIKDLEPLKSFVPHEILGVEIDATKAQVKKAYRRLSRDKHPDKNPDNPEAVNEFIQITKAYTIMTDEKARSNFEKFGNPDGQGSFAVGIALPTFIQKAEFQVQVLVAFFILVVFLIPGYFMKQIEAGQKDIGGVELETRKIFSECIDQTMDQKKVPAILQFSNEFYSLGAVTSEEEGKLLMNLKKNATIAQFLPKQREGMPPIQVKPIILLVAFMHGLLKEEDKKIGKVDRDLEYMLKQLPVLMEIMLEQTMELSYRFRSGLSQKPITAKNVLTLIQFTQNLMTGAMQQKDPYSQLPGFGEKEIQRVNEKMKKKTIYQYATLPKSERLELAPYIFGFEEGSSDLKKAVEQQELCIEALPIVELQMTAEVEDEDEVVVGDVLTCKLTVKFMNLEAGQKTGFAHSKHYPFLKRDNWFLIITDEHLQNLAAVEKLYLSDSKFEKEFKERIHRPGRIAFTAILTNDSYRGLDQMKKVEVDVKARATKRKEIEYTKYDVKEVKQLNNLQQMLLAQQNEEADDIEFEADNEEDELRQKLALTGLKMYGNKEAASTDGSSKPTSEDEGETKKDQ